MKESTISPHSALKKKSARSRIDSSDHTQNSFKILVTVGTDLPFDRLVKAVDTWAADNDRDDIFAQIGETQWQPSHIAHSRFLEPPVFNEMFQNAEVIISHAGMGTILSSLRFQKPLLVMPRIASKGEHRNEHQIATARHLSKLQKINVATDEIELVSMLNNLDQLPIREKIGDYASDSLVEKLRNFITEV